MAESREHGSDDLPPNGHLHLLALPQKPLDLIMTFACSSCDDMHAVSKGSWKERQELMAQGWLKRPPISSSTGTRPYPGEHVSKFLVSKKYFLAAARAYLSDRRVDLEWFMPPPELQGCAGVIGAFAKGALRELDNVRPFPVLYKMTHLRLHVCQVLVDWYQPVFEIVLDQRTLREISKLFPLKDVGGGVELELRPCPECFFNEAEEWMEVFRVNVGHLQVRLQDKINSRKSTALTYWETRLAPGTGCQGKTLYLGSRVRLASVGAVLASRPGLPEYLKREARPNYTVERRSTPSVRHKRGSMATENLSLGDNLGMDTKASSRPSEEQECPVDIQKPLARDLAGVEIEKSVEQGESPEPGGLQMLSISKITSIDIPPSPLIARPQSGTQPSRFSSSAKGAERASDVTPNLGFSKIIATDIAPSPVQTRSQQPSEASIEWACWIARCKSYLAEASAALQTFERSRAGMLETDRKIKAIRKELVVQERRVERLEAEAEASEAAERDGMEKPKLARLKDVAESWLVTVLDRAVEQKMALQERVMPPLRMIERHFHATLNALHVALLGIELSLLAWVLFLVGSRFVLPAVLEIRGYLGEVILRWAYGGV